MKKQRMLAAGFIFLLFFGTYAQSSAKISKTKALRPLHDIMAVTDKENIDLEQWGMYTKNISRLSAGRRGYEEKVQSFQTQLPQFQWSTVHQDGEGQLKSSGTHIDRHTGIKETFTVIGYQQGSQWYLYTIYNIGAGRWHQKKWERFSPTFSHRMQEYFPEDARIFTCIKGLISDKMDGSLYMKANNLLEDFSASPVEKIKEETFISLSAYTEQWKPSIQTQGNPMNLQVALRKNGETGATRVTIGTPIITSEY